MLERGWMRSGLFSYRPSNHNPACCCPNLAVKLNVARLESSKAYAKVLRLWERILSGDTPIEAKPSKGTTLISLRTRCVADKRLFHADSEPAKAKPPPAAMPEFQDPETPLLRAATILLSKIIVCAFPSLASCEIDSVDPSRELWLRLAASELCTVQSPPRAVSKSRGTLIGASESKRIKSDPALVLASSPSAFRLSRVLPGGLSPRRVAQALAEVPVDSVAPELVPFGLSLQAAPSGHVNIVASDSAVQDALVTLFGSQFDQTVAAWHAAHPPETPTLAASASSAAATEEAHEEEEEVASGESLLPEQQVPVAPPPNIPDTATTVPPPVHLVHKNFQDEMSRFLALEDRWALDLRFKHTRQAAPWWPAHSPTGWRGEQIGSVPPPPVVRPEATPWEARQERETGRHVPRLRVTLRPAGYSEEAHELYMRYNSEIHGTPVSISDKKSFERHLCTSPLVAEPARGLSPSVLMERGIPNAWDAVEALQELRRVRSVGHVAQMRRDQEKERTKDRENGVAKWKATADRANVLLRRVTLLSSDWHASGVTFSPSKPALPPASSSAAASGFQPGFLFGRLLGMQSPPVSPPAEVAREPPRPPWSALPSLWDPSAEEAAANRRGLVPLLHAQSRLPVIECEDVWGISFANAPMEASQRVNSALVRLEEDLSVAESRQAQAIALKQQSDPLPGDAALAQAREWLFSAWKALSRSLDSLTSAAEAAAEPLQLDSLAHESSQSVTAFSWVAGQTRERAVDVYRTHARNSLWSARAGIWAAESDSVDEGERGRECFESVSHGRTFDPLPVAPGLEQLYGHFGDPDVDFATGFHHLAESVPEEPPGGGENQTPWRIPSFHSTVPDMVYPKTRPPWHVRSAAAEGWDLRYGYGTFFMEYRIDGSLACVSVLDILPSRVASVYLFYNPDLRHLQWGRYTALREIAMCDRMRRISPCLRWFDLNFAVPGCSRMMYKAQYKPSLLLCPYHNVWTPLDRAMKVLAKDPHLPLFPAALPMDPASPVPTVGAEIIPCDPDSLAQRGPPSAAPGGLGAADEASNLWMLAHFRSVESVVLPLSRGEAWAGDTRSLSLSVPPVVDPLISLPPPDRVISSVVRRLQQEALYRSIPVLRLPFPRPPLPFPATHRLKTDPPLVPTRRAEHWPAGSAVQEVFELSQAVDTVDAMDDSVDPSALFLPRRLDGVDEATEGIMYHVEGSRQYIRAGHINTTALAKINEGIGEFVALYGPVLSSRVLVEPRYLMHFGGLEIRSRAPAPASSSAVAIQE
jgi:arginyl-tRNA--protein-N-Asp/Glu arginylyltransferase